MSTAALMRAPRRENDPPKSSGETALCATAARRYADAAHWDSLAARYLPRYTLPAWDVAFQPDAAEIWLDRLDIPVAGWLAVGNYRDLTEFSELNPGWPLRAWIGLAMELRHERDGEVEKWA